jgi:type IV secretion system protein VirB6
MTCQGLVDGAFLESALSFVDCQAQTIGAQGYQALAAPGSSMSMLLTGALTLFIGFLGYRLLFGETLGARDGVLAAVKVGIVLALATSWAAYRPLVYDVAFHGPVELASEIGRPADVPGTGGGLIVRLQMVDDALVTLGRLGTGPINMATGVQNVAGEDVSVAFGAPEPPTIFGSFALGTARLVYLTSTIAAFASVRLVAGLLIALGPFFLAFLLFDGTRSLVEGWVRGLAAAAIGALAVTMLLGIELALLEPRLATLIALREAQLPIGGAPTELLVVTFAFALTLVAGLGMAARIVLGFRLPQALRRSSTRLAEAVSERVAERIGERGAPAERHTGPPAGQRSRAAAVAEAVALSQRREVAAAAAGTTSMRGPAVTAAGSAHGGPPAGNAPLGQTNRRRTRSRVSASVRRRDSNR